MRKLALMLIVGPLSLLLFAAISAGDTVKVATWNIENFNRHFQAHRASTRLAGKKQTDEQKEEIAALRTADDEDNWEIAETILDKDFSPDLLVIEECCGQADLEYFNHKWMKDAYKTIIVFPTNSERDQNLALILKPGYQVIRRSDQYYLEKDAAGGNERGDRLFARGPGFALVEAPDGWRFWVGVTHQKSKRGDNVETTKWRLREAARAHDIVESLRKEGPADVILLGDMNDEFGVQGFENAAGGDTVATLRGDDLTLVTEGLAKEGRISFHGYWREDFRSLIDHAVVTPELKDQVQGVEIFTGAMARSASDHYPVMVRLRSEPPAIRPTTLPATTPTPGAGN